MNRTLFSAFALSGLLAIGLPASAQPTPAPQPAAAPSPSPSPSATPSSAPAPLPSGVTPSPVPPSPTASPVAYKFVSTPAPVANADLAAPKIIEIDFNDSTLHAPGPVDVRVLTSPNVATVTGKLLGHDIPIPQSAPGVFIFHFDLPSVPFFIYGKHPIDFVAATTDGKSAQSSVVIRLAH